MIVAGARHMPELLTVDEVAAFLRTTPQAIRHMISRGRLPGVVKIGRNVRVRSEDLRRSVGLLSTPPTNGSRGPKG